MPLDRVPGDDKLYIGSAFAAHHKGMLDSHGVTHILSVLQQFPTDRDVDSTRRRLFIDVDDVEDEDILVHLPRCVRFIEEGLTSELLQPAATQAGDRADGAETVMRASSDESTPAGSGAVYVHCAMGKSRSATAVIAFLLWKYPRRFGGGASALNPFPPDAAEGAVQAALGLLRQSRPIVEPNPGFMKQLALWWKMGCPAGSDDSVEKNAMYQRWIYQKDVEESAKIGRAPGRLWFGDEEDSVDHSTNANRKAAGLSSVPGSSDVQLRCKKCRQVLADSKFIIPHQPGKGENNDHTSPPCPHYFVEPLSWMRPVLEEGALEGRLVCPNLSCNASIGRYSWQGFKCSCHEWVCPAFSLQRSKVDQIQNLGRDKAASVAMFGIRLPLKDTTTATGNNKAENL